MKGNEILTKPEDSGLQVTLDELFEELTDEQNKRIVENRDLPDWIVYRIRILEPIVRGPGYVVAGDIWHKLKGEFREARSVPVFERSWEVISSYVHTGKRPPDKKPASARSPSQQPERAEQSGKIVRPKYPTLGQ